MLSTGAQEVLAYASLCIYFSMKVKNFIRKNNYLFTSVTSQNISHILMGPPVCVAAVILQSCCCKNHIGIHWMILDKMCQFFKCPILGLFT